MSSTSFASILEPSNRCRILREPSSPPLQRFFEIGIGGISTLKSTTTTVVVHGGGKLSRFHWGILGDHANNQSISYFLSPPSPLHSPSASTLPRNNTAGYHAAPVAGDACSLHVKFANRKVWGERPRVCKSKKTNLQTRYGFANALGQFSGMQTGLEFANSSA